MLDIIVPAYKDVEGLKRTLKSVYFPQFKDWLTITVVDDCSPIKFDEVEKMYPDITWYHLPENHGPGYARQYGIDHTTQPYIMFVDCGDIIFSKYSLLEVKEVIEERPSYYLFLWSWVSEKTKMIKGNGCRSTQGWVYNRELFNLYKIRFCTDKVGGYAHEDIGFNHTCVMIIKYMENRDNKQYSLFSQVPIYKKIDYAESLTNLNNYRINTALHGLSANAMLVIQQLEENNIPLEYILDELNGLMVSVYKYFLRCVATDTTVLSKHWPIVRQFYLTTYKKYENLPENDMYLTLRIGKAISTLRKIYPHPNVRRFIADLNAYEQCPQHYYNLKE